MNVPAQQNQVSQLPAHLQGFQSRSLSRTVAANIGTSAPPYVSIQGNKFTLVDAAGNEQPTGAYDPSIGVYLDCVIFDANEHLSKVYYEKAFDPNAASFMPPDCWADNGTGPSRQASHPQSNLCSACPKNEWGSAVSKVSGKGVKACNDQQKVAVYVPGFQTFFLLRIPPNSLKNFRSYAERFNGQNFDMDVMITRISFEPQGVGTLLFNAVNWIDQNIAAVIADARSKNATDGLVGRTDVARDPAQPLAQVAPAAGVPAAQVAPVTMPPPAQGFPPPPQPGFQTAPYPTGASPSPLPTAPAVNPAPAAMVPQAPMQPSQAAPSPSEPAPRGRGRRRNTAPAEPQAPAAPQQAPFPHPGQQAAPVQQAVPMQQQAPTQPAAASGAFPTPQPNFGIQPAPAVGDPALRAALDTAFGPR